MSDDTLAARVAAAQALAAAATPGPWRSGRNGRLRMVISAEQSTPTGRRWQMRADVGTAGGVANEDADAALMAAAHDHAELVAELWSAYMAACDKADGRDRAEANVRRLTRELDEARAEAARLRTLCATVPSWGEHCAGLGEPSITTPTEED